jgi:hypothetical protein
MKGREPRLPYAQRHRVSRQVSALALPERLKIPGVKTGSIERGFSEAYIVAQAEIEMGTSYDEQIASRRLRVFFILWQTRRMHE